MRFVATICHQATTLARVSVDDLSDETLSQLADRAARTLQRDANRHRSARLADETLAQIATLYGEVCASQTISGQSRAVTVVVRDGAVHKMEGEVALLTGPDDLVAMIHAHDDAWIADREGFVQNMLGGGRAAA